MTEHGDLLAAAFNEGSDARLAGQPITDCPYATLFRMEPSMRDGWEHVEHYWPKQFRRFLDDYERQCPDCPHHRN